MFKLAGIILLMIGCIGLGIGRVKDEKRRILELHQIKRIILRIQNEIVYGKRTLPEICFLLGKYMEEPYQSIFSSLYQKQKENSGYVLEKLWKEQMEEGMKELPLKKDEKDILRNLPEHLGIQDETMQAADIGQSMDMLQERIKQAEAGYENKARVIMSISVMAGLFISILLI